MKRIICLLCALLIVVTAVGCTSEPQEMLDFSNYDERLTYIELDKVVRAPGDYVGRDMKLNGVYMTSKNEATGETMHICLVTDDTACCSTFIEFQLKTGAEYPPENTKITVSGNIQTVKRISTTYGILLNATLE